MTPEPLSREPCDGCGAYYSRLERCTCVPARWEREQALDEAVVERDAVLRDLVEWAESSLPVGSDKARCVMCTAVWPNHIGECPVGRIEALLGGE